MRISRDIIYIWSGACYASTKMRWKPRQDHARSGPLQDPRGLKAMWLPGHHNILPKTCALTPSRSKSSARFNREVSEGSPLSQLRPCANHYFFRPGSLTVVDSRSLRSPEWPDQETRLWSGVRCMDTQWFETWATLKIQPLWRPISPRKCLGRGDEETRTRRTAGNLPTTTEAPVSTQSIIWALRWKSRFSMIFLCLPCHIFLYI
jgi:hypothetical protein